MTEHYLRTSERNLFKDCQWKWWQEYVERLKPRKSESVALWFGTGIHLALEKWYIPGRKRGVNPVETWIKYVEDSQADTEYINLYQDGEFSEAVEAKELGIDMLENYLDFYGEEPHLEVLAAEEPFNVKILHDEFEPGEDGGIHRVGTASHYVGTIDLVFRDHEAGRIYLADHKTAASLGSSNTQYLPLDDQAGTYMTVAEHILKKSGKIGPKEKVSGIVYNYLAKKMRDTRPTNSEGFATNKPQKKHYVAQLTGEGLDKMTVAQLVSLAEEQGVEVVGEVSKQQPAPTLERKISLRSQAEKRSQLERIRDDLTAMSLVENGILPPMKSPSRNCSFCPFKELCELDEQKKSLVDFKEQVFKTWNPYEAHQQKENISHG